MIDVLLRDRKGKNHPETRSGEGPWEVFYEDRGRDWREAAMSQVMLAATRCQRGKEGVTPTAFRGGVALLRIWISDFCPPDV